MDLFFELFEKPVKVVNAIIIVLAGCSLPIFAIGIIFGLAGSTSHYYALIAFSYIGVLFCGIVAIFRPKFFIGTLVFSILIISGFILDSMFWENHNAELCLKIKMEPSCSETEYGYSCKNIDGISASFSKNICK